jgi:hypothetical protein
VNIPPELAELIPLLLPILILQFALLVLALRDLLRPERRVQGDTKVLWGIVIVVFQLLGPILYFAVGRREE